MNEKIDRVKKHLAENKAAYISAGVGLVVGAAGMYVCGGASTAKATQTIGGLVNIKPIQNLTQVTIVMKRKGTLSNFVEHLETGHIYQSQNDAAKALDLDPGALSKHLNGRSPHVKNNHFKVVGEPTAA